MAIPSINLDNRTFDDLVAELRGLIPRHAPDWTNHNASDPGITLLELFCWVGEGLIYRTNRIPESSRRRFLELLGTEVTGTLDDAVAATVRSLQSPWRAVTTADFETLVLTAFPLVARACCLADRALDRSGPDEERTGHVSVIVVPHPDSGAMAPAPALLDEVYRFLDERRLITCCHHVVGPAFTPVALSATVVCSAALSLVTVRERVLAALRDFFAPVAVAPDGGVIGWEFGHPVYESELYAMIEGVAGVDHLEKLALLQTSADGWQAAGRMIAIPLNSLVSFDEGASSIEVASVTQVLP
ncbi:hypothetical protein OR1_02460 [Geobacter sp. OR-1]|uniref:baseplate J/gp47 family protein n=1 Tax=Geobacter sp. OR-1 TaxID=1266765 RepID=UPI000543427D|nr:baseplate J/gp47 family protein [Geobacter sp. OR-1]GAM10172.1 hypothetical protein OR1_02460 [Geobacter sp. OR-1]